MGNNKEIIEQKEKIIIQKIEKLHNIYAITLQKDNCKELSSLEIIKEQYLRMYNAIKEKEEYDKYQEVEDIIINEIAKIELSLDEYIYETRENCTNAILNKMQEIKISENYQNFHNIEEEIKKVEVLKDILKLYKPYIKNEEYENIKENISNLKFEILYRKQVEELIYKNGGETSYLLQYDDEEEKKVFIDLLKQKINSLIVLEVESIENDDILKVGPDRILNDVKLIERLIIIDMKKISLNYINLLKAPIFNAHLCNIGDNQFREETYLTKKEFDILLDWNYRFCKPYSSLKANKANYSLLRAVLENIITDENISIIECDKLYKIFGFRCVPKTITTGQKCIYMLYNRMKKSKDFELIYKENERETKNNYCKIPFKGLVYEFEDYDEEEIDKDNINQILKERKIPKGLSKAKFYQKRKKETENEEEQDKIQNKKYEVKKYGYVTTDFEVLIALMQDIIENCEEKKEELSKRLEKYSEEEKNDFIISPYTRDKYDVYKYENKIKEQNKRITELREIKEKNVMTNEEVKRMLMIINSTYKELDIKRNSWRILVLESMEKQLAPIPETDGYERVEVSHSFLYGSEYEDRYYHRTYVKPLWKKYKKDFKDLGIDIKMYNKHYPCTPEFETCINLADISDLPIDYEKVKLIPEEEMKEIIEREEGNER